MSGGTQACRKLAGATACGAILLCIPILRAQAGLITTAAGPSLNDSSVSGASFVQPTSVALDSAGNIYTADPDNCVVWKTHYGTTSIFAGILASTQYSCSSGAATTVPTTTPLAYPVAVAQCNGNVFIATNGIDPSLTSGATEVGGTVDEVDTNGNLSTLPLPGGPGGGAGPLHPVAIACDAKGNVYVSSYFYNAAGSLASGVDEFSPAPGGTGWTTTTPVNAALGYGYPAIAVSPTNGDLYGILASQVTAGWLGQPRLSFGNIWDITQNAAGLSSNPSFYNASALAIDSNGNFYISEAVPPYEYTGYVELVQSDGTKTVIAGLGTAGYNGDGILSTQAEVSGVTGLALDSTNSYIYLADSGNQRVRRIHSLTAGPAALSLVSTSVPQSAGATYGTLQGALNSNSGDFYYVTGTNTVNVINTGASVLSPGYERIIASIPVGEAGQAVYGSALTLVIDSTRNLIYVSNTVDGNLYVINGETHTVVGSVALDNPNASLLAIDIALNEVYAGGPNAVTVSAVRGGTSPQLIGNSGHPVNSLSVDAGSDQVYAVADSGAGGAQQEALITMTPAPVTGVLAVSSTTFPANEEILQPAFITNSIAADPLSGSLIASGAASINPGSGQYYDVYDIFQFTPTFITASVQYTWPPITTSLDIPNRVFYITDYDGHPSDPSSNATMVTGIDGVVAGNNTLTSVTIPVFGSGATPSSPHIFDAEPDTGSYQAWISGSDAADGGFVRLWDAASQKVTLSVTIPNNGGGHLFVNPGAQAAYLLDEVNGQLWLIDTLQWTPTPAPLLTQPQNGQSVTISAVNSGDAVYYTLDGTPPGLGSTPCSSPCMVNLTQGAFLTINAIEVATVSGVQYASNVAQGVFTAPAPTSLAINLSPTPATTGATLTVTATITPSGGISSVTGTVNFTATPSGSSAPVSLCSQVSVVNNMGSWQAVCNFVEDSAESYTIAAAYAGDAMNEGSNNTAPLTVVQGTIPILGTISGVSNALAINSNNSAGLAYNAVLNSDSSVSLLQNGAELPGQGCPAFSSLSSGIGSGAVYVDFANSRIYLAMLAGPLYVAYESIDQQGNCTQGPLLQLSNTPLGSLQMNVDPVQGNMYVMNYFGAFPDALYIVPTAPWNPSALPTPAEVNLDYSAQYGPVVIDPSNHQVYINDLGGSAYGTVGTYATSGFFVYDPNQSATPASNLQHVVGYSTGGVATPFNVGTLLDNGAGKLVLVNENPSASSANLNVPITILDTSQFSFFTNTSNPYSYNSDVDITPGAGLSTISATSHYSAMGGADIDTANNVVYAFGFNSNSLTAPGLLLEYNLYPAASPQETVLSSSTAMPNLGYSVPWSRMNYNPETTEMALSASVYGSGALGLTSPLCAGTPLSLTQVAGSSATPSSIGYPVVNATSGYVYVIQSGSIDYVAPPPGCTTSTSIQISPATIPDGIVGGQYSQTLTASGGSGGGYTWTVTAGTALSAVGLSLSPAGTISGTPTGPETAAAFTVQVTDSQGNSATQNYTLTIYPALSITPSTLPAGTVGTPYSQTLAASGGSSTGYTFTVTAGTALSAVGLTLSTAGTISGSPTGPETAAAFTVQVTDSQGNATTQNYTLTINSSVLGPAQVTDNETITVTDTETFPDVADSERITVTDSEVVRAYNAITIAPSPAYFNASSGNGYATHAYTPVQFTATGGIGTLTLSEGGALPMGITFTNGVLSGTPAISSVGTFPFTVTVTDADGDLLTLQGYSLTIQAASAFPAVVTDDEIITVTDTETFPDIADSETISVTDTDTVRAFNPVAITPTPATFNASDGSAIAGAPYGPVKFTATGGTGTLTLTESGTLPAGLAFTNGALGGTLSSTSAGAYTFSVTAADTYNDQTTVQGYTLNVAALPPSLTISASPVTLTIVQGQTGQTTLTFTPQGGYSGTLTLSCSGLPANTLCVFTLNGTPVNSVTLTGNNQPVSVVLTIETDVNGQQARIESAPTPLRPGAILTAIAFWCPGSMLGLLALSRKRKLFTRNPRSFGLCLFVLLVGTFAGVAGCISGGGFGPYVTPVGTSTVTVVITPSSGPAQTLSIGVTITH